MMNDRDDKFEGQDESEYHFSDDDVSYELDDETTKAADAPAEVTEPLKKESFIKQITQSKRLLASLGVFLVLVVAVYKMVAPTSVTPATDIVASAPPAAPISATPVTPVTQQAAAAQPQTAPVQAQPAMQPLATPQQTANQQTANQQTAAIAAAAQSMVQSVAGALPNQVPTATNNMQGATTITVPSTPTVSVSPPNQVPNGSYVVPTAGNPDDKIAAMAANNDRLIGQLQNQYTQQYNEFNNQNRTLQEQVQTLNSRISVIENQLGQLIEALTKRNTDQNGASLTGPTRLEPQRNAAGGKIAYNVQAIIPGRAWLKSYNGETVTVAEGDAIKGVGRVTKIDPYDGVVIISTGNKSISLSYGDNA